jgi:hypothetical protein
VAHHALARKLGEQLPLARCCCLLLSSGNGFGCCDLCLPFDIGLRRCVAKLPHCADARLDEHGAKLIEALASAIVERHQPVAQLGFAPQRSCHGEFARPEHLVNVPSGVVTANSVFAPQIGNSIDNTLDGA